MRTQKRVFSGPEFSMKETRENYRLRSLEELAGLGISVSRYDPTTNDVPLSIKIEGGRVRTDFNPSTPLARGEVINISNLWDSSQGDNPTIKIIGKLFLQLTMRTEDQKRLFLNYPQRIYLPISEDSNMILDYQNALDLIPLGVHDYNPDNTHLWPGIPPQLFICPPGTPYDPDNPPIIKEDGFPYIQQGASHSGQTGDPYDKFTV